MGSVSGLDRADRRLLEFLNDGGVPGKSVPRNQVDRLMESGFIAESDLGGLHITTRGQLELARWRFRNLPKPRYVVMKYPKLRPNLWRKFFTYN